MKLENIPTIRDLLDEAPVKHNDRTFIKFLRDGEIVEKKFSEVRRDSLAFCRKLRHDLPEGSHVAILSKSTYEYMIAVTGVLVGNLVAVPTDPDGSAEETAAILNDAHVTAVLYCNETTDLMNEIKALCPAVTYTMNIGDLAAVQSVFDTYGETSEFAYLSDIPMHHDTCCVIIYTSGTTGDKKGVMLSSDALVANLMFEPYSDIVVRADTILSVLPLHHIFCFITGYVGPLKVGNCVCLNGEMRDLFKNLLLFKPDQMRVVPMIAQALLARIRAVQHKNPDLSLKEAAAQITGGNLDLMLAGGAYLDPALARAFDEMGILLRQGYGMSEAGCKITVPDLDSDVNSVGRLMNIVDVRIVGGEIQVDTPCLMLGYYNNPEATAEAITEDGWLRTGDIGFVDEKRQLFITGRLKNLIILSNGENVSPEGIENRLKCNKLVSEVLVFAEKDRIVAEIYPDTEYAEQAGITDIRTALEQWTDECNRTASPNQIIARLIISDTPLEKTSTGKIKRTKNNA